MNCSIPLVLAALIVPISAPAFAQHDHHSMPSVPAAKASMLPSLTDGVVKRLDKATGRITIAHEPIRNLDMPKMTMTFRVKDSAWLDRVKEGDRVRFAAEAPNGVLTVVALDGSK